MSVARPVSRYPVRQVVKHIGTAFTAEEEPAPLQSLAIDATGLLLTATYDGNVAAAEALTLYAGHGPLAATYSSGEGSTAIVYALDRPAHDGEIVLAAGDGFDLAQAANVSEVARPDNAFVLNRHGAITGPTAASYFNTIVDVSDAPNSPWRVALLSSTDHGGGGIFLRGGYGGDAADPTTWTWETYDTAVGRGEFSETDFPGRPASYKIYDDGSETEVPRCVKMGSDYWMTYSDEEAQDSYWSAQPSPAKLAKATGFPLIFVRFDNGNEGRVIDWEIAPFVEWPTNSHGTYLKWGPNPFAGVPYTYVGYGLMHGDQGHEFQAGSNDGESWTILGQLDKFLVPELGEYEAGNPYKANPSVDPAFVHYAGGGEYVTVTTVAPNNAGGISTPNYIYELWLAEDGVTVTRALRLYASPGGEGDIDEYSLGVFAYYEYQDGKWMAVYRAKDASDDRRLALATIDVTMGASRPTPRTRPPHDVYTYEALGSVALPAWLEDVSDDPAPHTGTPAGYAVASAQGFRLFGRSGGRAAIRSAATYTPSSVGYLEAYLEHGYIESIAGGNAYELRLGFTDDISGANGVQMAASGSTSDIPLLRIREASATTSSKTVAKHMLTNQTQRGRRHQFGIAWDVGGDEFQWLAGKGQRPRETLAADAAPAGSSVRFHYSAAFSSTLTGVVIEKLVLRVGNPTGNAIPVATISTTNSRTLTLTLDRACIGLGEGLSVNVGGSPVSGVWIRDSATSYRFVRASGSFVDTDTITLDIASTDIRSQADLVALQDATGVAVSNTL